MQIALITGGAGFIGSHLVRFLLTHGRVRVLDDLSTGTLENLHEVRDQIDFVHGSVTDPALVQEAMRGVQYVFHLGALASVPLSMEQPVQTFEVNTLGTQFLLEAARQAGVERFVFASSAAVYGNSPRLPKRETMRPAPISPYAWTKLYSEQLCTDYYHVYDLPTVSLRFFNVYGARQNPNSHYAAVVPRWITAALTGNRPIVYGDGKQLRDFVYIGDLVNALWLAALQPNAVGRVFNIASGEQHTLLELLEAIEQAIGKPLNPLFDEPRAGDIRRSFADTSAARQWLRFQPKTSLREGIRLTLEAYRSAVVEV
jgi:nucleoside-diphosphate-sugar epimerase